MRVTVLSLAAVVTLLYTSSAPGLRMANPIQAPVQRAATADAVVVGTVAAIEAEPVLADPYKGSPNKVPYQVAVIKVSETLSGATGLTHVKVGFQKPSDPPVIRRGDNPGVPVRRPGPQQPTLAVDQTGCYFLVKHPTAGFYTLQPSAPPLDSKGPTFKSQLAKVKTALAAVAHPVKALTADMAEDRALATAALIAHYRSVRPGGGPVAQVPVGRHESQLILKGLLEQDWSKFDPDLPAPVAVFRQLGLTPQDGWTPPAFNGQGDYNTFLKSAFARWVAADGSKFVVKKLVPKGK